MAATTTFESMVQAQAARFRGYFSQTVETTANDNRSAAMMVQDARAMRRWADSRASSPAFAGFVAQARQQAAVTMQQFAPRAV